ncbi:MAG: hypothetical protein LBL95_05255 [Deltaproteobacteria bacterium]|jgi:hypothetical protein|nr:hypothetical protein [Deltaproteobacteria bacterium]
MPAKVPPKTVRPASGLLLSLTAILAILGQAILGHPSGLAAAENPALEVSFEFGPGNKGPRGPSPAIMVKGIPDGTVRLEAELSDLNKPNFRHGGGVYELQGEVGEATIPAGALTRRYKGPYPPRNSTHDYVFKITAVGPDGQILATGAAQRPFTGM